MSANDLEGVREKEEMKFKALARSEKRCTRELSSDVRVRPRNTAPEVSDLDSCKLDKSQSSDRED